jgi:two-component system sensor histidine kinase PilS (NtrC family)
VADVDGRHLTETIARPRTRTRDRAPKSPADSLIRPPEAPPPADFGRRVSRLIFLRTLVVSVVLGLSVWLLYAGQQPVRGAVWLQSAIIAITYLSSIVFGVLLRVGVAPRKVVRPMLAVDLAITSILVFVTGGAQSPYTFLYALSIVSAGALSYRRGAVVVTAGAILSLIVVAALAWMRAIDVPMSVRPWEQTAADLARTLGIQFASMVGVGALAFIFGDQLQKGAETLATTRKAAADLFTLHQDIVRSLASGLITIAPDGTVLTANDAACDILGLSVGDLANKSIDTVMPGLSALLANKGELRRADLTIDDDLALGVTVSPLRDVRDQVIGRVVNFTDLTELRRLEQHMRRSERLATVGQLAAGVAHEIRNPLASISGSIQLLKESPASEDDRALMTIVNREIERLNVLIGDLLDYANPRPSQPVDFDLDVLVRESLQVFRADQAFADIEMTTNVAGPLTVYADSSKLRQVMWNLLRNAADAAAAGGKHVTVTATLGVTDDEARICVEDDGPGIPSDKIANIFDPFFTTKQKGTGLGLATCHAVILEHGGRIDVDSEVGKGTKMVVTLPRNRSRDESRLAT